MNEGACLARDPHMCVFDILHFTIRGQQLLKADLKLLDNGVSHTYEQEHSIIQDSHLSMSDIDNPFPVITLMMG